MADQGGKYVFHVKGMHCQSCVFLTESVLSELPGVRNAKSDLKTHSVEISGDFGGRSPEEIAEELGQSLIPEGYSLSVEKKGHVADWPQFKIALPIALSFIALFIILQKLGIVNLVTASSVGYGTAFAIGVIASLSTCMAVVGGLVLSMSASFAKGGDKTRPQILFHLGRLFSFFLLGGLIGAVGSVWQPGLTGNFLLSFFIALILIVLGINLLDVFPWAKKLQPTLPGFVGRRVHGLKSMNHTLTPVLVGVATFFLPCGFTQSMQIYTLSTGSFLSGALIMCMFALGTLPVLLLLSFSALSISPSKRGIFFKTAGIIVIFFGIFNLLSSLTVFGVIPPLFNL